MATTLRRPDPMPSRAAQRKQRLLELENEQRLEDAEALKFTEEQRLSLFHSFRSVKFEWSDLDGMRSVRRRYNSSCPASPPPPPRSPAVQPHICVPHISISPPHLHQVQAQPVSVSPTSTPAAFAVLTNAHLASFGKDDTIRGHSHTLVAFPGSPQKYYGSTPTPYDSTLARAPPGLARSLSSPSAPASAPALAPAPPSVSRSYSSPPPSPPPLPGADKTLAPRLSLS
ncbi:hypothetical protein B0H19DRAFT_11726 [Mycena capillaripes]|nr:hypothetical protein B0H19DRAFT_11726 [Mycena capillaripes]